MAITHVRTIGTANQDGVASETITVPAAGVAAGDCIVVGIQGEVIGTLTVTDSASNSYTIYSKPNGTTNVFAAFAVCLNCSALSSGQTITISATGVSNAVADEFSGVATTSALDGSVTWAVGSSTTPNSGSLTTANANDLLCGVIATRGSSGQTFTRSDSMTDTGHPGDALSDGEYVDEAYRIVSATGSYSCSATIPTNPWVCGIIALKAAGGGGTVNGSATATGEGGILGGVGGGGNTFTGISGMVGLGEGLAGVGGVGDGLSGHGNINASSAATPSETLTGTGALGTGLAGSGSLASGVAGSGGLGGGLAGSGAVGGGLAGSGSLIAQSTALASALFQGMGALAGNFLAGVGNLLPPSGSLGGAIHGVATILGMGAMLLGFGGHGDIQASSAATPGVTLEGSGALGGGVAGSGAVNASSAALDSATLQGSGSIGTGLSGSGSVSSKSAATPSLTLTGMGAFLAGLFAGRGIIVPPQVTITGIRLWRWVYTSTVAFINQVFGKPAPQVKMVYAALGLITMSFSRETPVAQPNTTILVTMTATDSSGNPITNLSVVTCTVTFPDGSTSAFSLGSGIVNAGSGKYTLTYTTKGPGENVEDWKGTDASGNVCEFHNETPVSF